MRILFINEVCGHTSTGKICAAQAEDFAKRGDEVRIAYGRDDYVPEPYKPHAVRIGSDLDVRLHGVMTRLLDAHGLGSTGATKRFLEWAEQYNPDLLWLHNLHGYYINYKLLFEWIKKRPGMEVRWTLHDCWAFTGHCSYFTMAKCDQWKTHCARCPQKKRYPASYGLDGCKRNYTQKRASFTGVKRMTLITPSNWLAELVRQSFLKEYPVEVHYNTIDRTVFKPTPSDFRERYGLQDKIMVLGVASVWDDRKGLDDFVKLARMLDERYAIVLVGLTDKQIRQMPKNILGLGKTNSAVELAQIYTAADFFFDPTYEDNYPTVNLEAEACGCPVITYDTGGCRETIHNPASHVIPCGDYTAILKIISNPVTIYITSQKTI